MKNISSIDLNLLNIFVVLMEERNVSVAAKRVRLSQPSVSHALSRLRDHFNDPLLVRSSRGMVPTPKALQLNEPIRIHIHALDELLAREQPFDPASATGTLHVSATDVFEHLLLPRLIPACQKEAPNLNLSCQNAPEHLPKAELEKGLVDIAIAAFFEELSEGFHKQRLYEERFVGLARKGHPIFRKKATVRDLVRFPHIAISLKGSKEHAIDEELRRKNLKRRIFFSVANLLSPGQLVAESECIMVTPSRIAEHFSKQHDVTTFNLPIELKSFDVVQVWHSRMHRDPKHRWFRQQMQRICESY